MPGAYDTYPDDFLLELWKQNDNTAFEQFYRRHFLKLAMYADKRIGDWQLAEEITDDVFFVLYSNSQTINSNPLAYCRAVLKKKIVDHFRRAAQRPPRLSVLDPERHSLTYSHSVEYKEMETRVLHLIKALPEQCQRVFLLRRENNLSNQEVAERLGISIKTVENHMTKALSILREKLDYHLFAVALVGLNLIQ